MSALGVYPDLLDPNFSARECAKQLLLLEDHLASPEKRCPDCISKHRLTAEAFAEEALSLGAREPALQALPAQLRAAGGAQEVRAIRKDLTAYLRGCGMAGLGYVGLGRLRGLAGPVTYYYAVKPFTTAMDPAYYLATEPAQRLGLELAEVWPGGEWVLRTQAEPALVYEALRQDQRVEWRGVVRQEGEAAPVGPAVPAEVYGGRAYGVYGGDPAQLTEAQKLEIYGPAPAPIEPARPEPGKPPLQLPGYIPKTTEGGQALTWEEKMASEGKCPPMSRSCVRQDPVTCGCAEAWGAEPALATEAKAAAASLPWGWIIALGALAWFGGRR